MTNTEAAPIRDLAAAVEAAGDAHAACVRALTRLQLAAAALPPARLSPTLAGEAESSLRDALYCLDGLDFAALIDAAA